MFDSAKNFVIQNGVFIEVRDSAKFYARKFCPGRGIESFSGPLATRMDDARLSDYRRILRGDIVLLDRIIDDSKPTPIDNDYVIEVVGEQRKRAARLYRGQDAYSRFQSDFSILSKLWHPRITQVFGICDSAETPGIIFHDDGIYHGFSKHALSLNPLRRAAFCIKYTEEYYDTTCYLYDQFKIDYFAESKIYCSTLKYDRDYYRMVSFYVDSHSRLHTRLSIQNCDPFEDADSRRSYAHPDSNWDFLDRKMPRLSRQDIEFLQFFSDNNIIMSQASFQRAEVISTWHSALLSVGQLYSTTRQETTVFIGQPARIWDNWRGDKNTEQILYVPGRFKSLEVVLQPNTDISWVSTGTLFYGGATRVGKLTRFTLNTKAVMANKTIPNLHASIKMSTSVLTNCDKLCRSWLAQIPQMQKDLGLSCKHYNKQSSFRIGLVTDAQIDIEIQIQPVLLRRYIKDIPNAEIYMFISDPGLDPMDGRVILPSIHWSAQKSGARPLWRSQDDKSKGILAEISLRPKITYWNTFLYDALHELYRACGLELSRVSVMLGFPQFDYNIHGNSPWISISPETDDIPLLTDGYNSKVRHLKLASLSWIGVTLLEAQSLVRRTSYEFKQKNSERETTKNTAADGDNTRIFALGKAGSSRTDVIAADAKVKRKRGGATGGVESLEEWENIV